MPKFDINFIQKHLWIPPSKCDRIATKIYGLEQHFNVKISFTNNNGHENGRYNLTITGAPYKVEAVCERINIYLVDLPGERFSTTTSSRSGGGDSGYRGLESQQGDEGHGRHRALEGHQRSSGTYDHERPESSQHYSNRPSELASAASGTRIRIQEKFECSVCFDSFNIDEKCVKCSKDDNSGASSGNDDEIHSICLSCIKSYAHSSITGSSIAFGGIGLKCVEPECKNVFLLSSFDFCIDKIDYVPLKERLQQQCIADANLDDLVTCSECNLKVCVPSESIYYTCECGRKNCRSCNRIYDHKHFNKTCQQMDQDEANNISLRNLESKMSEAIIRNCNKCGLNYVKNDGCNKMECTCGAKQCYICKQQDIGYDHFCLCGITAEQHGPCSRCKKTCRIWENNEEIDNQKINEILDSANPLLQQTEYGSQFMHLPTEADNRRNARLLRQQGFLRIQEAADAAGIRIIPPPRQPQPPQQFRGFRPRAQQQQQQPIQRRPQQQQLPNHRPPMIPAQPRIYENQYIQPPYHEPFFVHILPQQNHQRERQQLQEQLPDVRYPPPPLPQPGPQQMNYGHYGPRQQNNNHRPFPQRPPPPPQFQQQQQNQFHFQQVIVDPIQQQFQIAQNFYPDNFMEPFQNLFQILRENGIQTFNQQNRYNH